MAGKASWRKRLVSPTAPTLADYKLNALPDVPDIRDRYYEPALMPLKLDSPPPPDLKILDQGTEGACTGYGLAAVINLQLAERKVGKAVSPHMLYHMARKHDEWPGEDYDGSSLRGALRGWHNNGACKDSLWVGPQDWPTVEQAKDARSVTLGAYYRLRPTLSDFHAALNECPAIYVSAAVHAGWQSPTVKDGRGEIKPGGSPLGFHAFAVVGYDADGFWVQNSWGSGWGANGLALWRYEDWVDNLQDAWVARLAVPVPQVFGRRGRSAVAGPAELREPAAPTRNEISGHFVHIDDGRFCDRQPYWSSAEDVRETAQVIAARFAERDEEKRYRHLLIYAHGGLNTPVDCARRIRAMTPTFKANGVYPYFVMYDTGFAETLKDIVFNAGQTTNERAGGFLDFTDMLIEKAVKGVGGRMWAEMKDNAREMFEKGGAGIETLLAFLDAMGNKDIKLHIVGHSLGSVLVGHLMEKLRGKSIATCSLMAPACRADFFNSVYPNSLEWVDNFAIYNLSDEMEQDDSVALYRKSLLYLVSNAFEGKHGTPLAGMDIFRSELQLPAAAAVHIASETSNVTRSATHGGFDEDPYTMNHILGRVLGDKPQHAFTHSNLAY
ncbi:MAG: peptidase C1 [Alphaproteobacteria bacterium]|nr:peptidase C1 [Alphaproteobacteria bacterium]